jgi:hypothetical protein
LKWAANLKSGLRNKNDNDGIQTTRFVLKTEFQKYQSCDGNRFISNLSHKDARVIFNSILVFQFYCHYFLFLFRSLEHSVFYSILSLWYFICFLLWFFWCLFHSILQNSIHFLHENHSLGNFLEDRYWNTCVHSLWRI